MKNPDSFLADLLDRVAAQDGKPVFLTEEELAEWPASLVTVLQKHGFLRKAAPSNSAPCDGCEELCVMPVFPASDGSSFIICDKRDDIHRVKIPASRLRRWKTSLPIIASALAQLMDLRPSSSDLLDGSRRVNVGVFRGQLHSAHIDLLVADDGQLLISLAGHEAPLIEVLRIREDDILVDRGRLTYLVDNPAGPAGGRETAQQRRERLIRRVEELKSQGVRGFLKQVAAEEGISDSTLKGIIYRRHA